MSTQLSTLASQCHALSHAVKLTAWVGKGRPVTAKGVLRPADLPAAAAVLGVPAPAKVRTAADVTLIHWPWLAAEAAGLIEVGIGKAVARKVDEDPAELWLKGLDAVLSAESRDRNRRGALTLCRAVLTALAADSPPSELEPAVQEILEEYEDAVDEVFVLSDAVTLLTAFGAIDGGRVTALGRWAHERFEARAPESVSPELPVSALLARLATLPEDEAWRQALRWFGERRPVDGAAQMLHMAEYSSPVERVAAVDVVAGFAAEALPAWRSALRYKNLRAHALAALADWDEGPGIDEAQRRWLVTEYALSAQAKGGVEEAYHYVRDSGGLSVLTASDHPGACELSETLSSFAASVRIRVHQLKIALDGIWRRVLVPAGVTLGTLHEIVQLVLDWNDEHVHAFDADGLRYSDPFYGLEEHRDEHEIRLSKVFARPGASLRYAYDFYECQITCEKLLEPDERLSYPACVAGQGEPFDKDELTRRLTGLGIPQPRD